MPRGCWAFIVLSLKAVVVNLFRGTILQNVPADGQPQLASLHEPKHEPGFNLSGSAANRHRSSSRIASYPLPALQHRLDLDNQIRAAAGTLTRYS